LCFVHFGVYGTIIVFTLLGAPLQAERLSRFDSKARYKFRNSKMANSIIEQVQALEGIERKKLFAFIF
jgi:hypothetical protein